MYKIVLVVLSAYALWALWQVGLALYNECKKTNVLSYDEYKKKHGPGRVA